MHRSAAVLLVLPISLATRAAAGQDMFPSSPPDFAAPAAPARPSQEREPVPPPLPLPARPPEPPAARFGARGQFVFGGGSNVGLSSTAYGGSSASNFSISFSPSFDVFVIDNVSLGLAATLSYSDNKGYGADSSLVRTRASTASAGPRIGVNVPLGRWASIWPVVTLSVESVHRDETVVMGATASVASPIAAPSTTLVGPAIGAYVPFLISGPHFFVGAGPSFFHEFGKAVGGPDVGGQRTTFGGGLTVGGTLGGAAAAEVPEPSRPRARAFGEAHEVVFTNEEVLSGYSTAYAGTGASLATLSLGLGVDWFVEKYFSMGAFVSGSYGNQVGFDPSGAKVTDAVSQFGGGPRLGVNIPLSRWFSLYPRIWLGIGAGSYDEESGASADRYSTFDAWFGAFAPLLVHPAPHFFVGFGPNVNVDLAQSTSFPNGGSVQNPATRFGAGLVIGAWL